jgi:UDP-N-acetylmuramoyl-tripeptide--D-alanyl-D-alanine ligase
MAHYLGVSIQNLQQRVGAIEAVEHRLQRIDAGGKVILDDSFNGNLEGMLDSYDIVSGYEGRKVIITPGIVESTEEANIELAKKIDEVFDIAIITGKLNAVTLATHIKRAKKIILNDKSKLEETLGKETRVGDLILFSNDAPSFI